MDNQMSDAERIVAEAVLARFAGIMPFDAREVAHTAVHALAENATPVMIEAGADAGDRAYDWQDQPWPVIAERIFAAMLRAETRKEQP